MKEYKKIHIFLFAFFIIGISSLLMIKSIQSFDYWWHIKAGEYIVTNKAIPFTDVFSWIGIKEGFYWHSHEWLTEVILFLNFKLFGQCSGYIFAVSLVLVLVILLYFFNRERYMQNKLLAIIWVFIGAFAFIYVSSPRPHLISFIFLTITIYLLYEYRENENSKKIWFIPFISFLWVNFHGGSSNLPYILTFIFIFTGLFNFEIGKISFNKLSNKQIKKYLIIAICSILVLIINPHGLDMITYPYTNMGDDFMLFNIAEWRSPDLKIKTDLIYYIIMAIPIMLFTTTKRKIDFIDLTLGVAFIYLTSKSVRFSILLYIVSTFFIFKYMEHLKIEIKSNKSNKLNKIIDKFREFSYKLVLAFSVAIIIIIPLTIITSDVPGRLFEAPISNEIIEYIKEAEPERLYNSYNAGGYLIYNDIPVFVDGRADMYSAGGTLKDAMKLDEMLVDVEEVINKYDFDMFLLAKDTQLIQYFEKTNEFKEVLKDDDYILFEKMK